MTGTEDEPMPPGSNEASGPDRNELDDPLLPGLKVAFARRPGNGSAHPRSSVVEALGENATGFTGVSLPDSALEPTLPLKPPPLDLAAGMMAGRYEILGEIARGGLGVVLKARDRDLGRETAMKVLWGPLEREPTMVRRFLEEAQIAGQLQHPGIIPVYEMGLLAGTRPFFTMKLVNGRTLAEFLRERRDPSQERRRFLGIFEQVCQAVAYSHSRGVIHRDLKPTNVMVGAFGEVQVMDWGLSKVLHPAAGRGAPSEASPPIDGIETLRSLRSGSESHAGTIMGTPAYMSPEQAKGQVDILDERTDVFGLRAILCEILTGSPPYQGALAVEVCAKAARGDLQDALGRLANLADAELAGIARRCLLVDRIGRPRDAGEVARAIGKYLSSIEERARAMEVAAAEAKMKAAEERRARRLALSLAASILLTIVLVAGGLLLWQMDRQERSERADHAVNAAMEEANLLWGQARSAPGGGLAQWSAALSAGRRAQALAAGEPASSALKARVGKLLEALQAEEEKARLAIEREETDRAMVARLVEIRLLRSDPVTEQWTGSDTEYGKAFRDYGIDVELPPRQAAQRIRQSAIAADLISALDYWTRARRISRPKDLAGWKKLAAIARETDQDPWRTRLRDADEAGDLGKLRELARSPEVPDLNLGTLDLLSESLAGLGDLEAGVAVCRAVYWNHPGDFLINIHIGLWLDSMSPKRSEQGLRYLLTAVAVRPRSISARLILAYALVNARNDGDLDAAQTACQEALKIEPQSHEAHHALGYVLIQKHDLDGAIVENLEAIRLKPDYAEAFSTVGAVLATKGDFLAAVTPLREAIRLRPEYADAHANLGGCLQELGDLDGSIAELREAIRINPRQLHAHFNLGSALLRKNDLEGSLKCFQEAARLLPIWPEAHGEMARVLMAGDRYQEALPLIHKAMELSLSRDNPEYHREMEVMLRRWEGRAGLIARLPEILRGDFEPSSPREGVQAADLCYAKGSYPASVTYWRTALEKEPSLAEDLAAGHRYNAACAAALAGCGKGVGAEASPESRTAWRRQALEWLRADLAAWKRVGAEADRSGEVLATFRNWKEDPDLQGVRDAEARKQFPAEERQAWSALWEDVEETLRSLKPR